MKILAVGDVVARPGRECIERHLKRLKRETGADFCVVNGENAAGGNGIRRKDYDLLMEQGADVITTGNHVWGKQTTLKPSMLQERLLQAVIKMKTRRNDFPLGDLSLRLFVSQAF